MKILHSMINKIYTFLLVFLILAIIDIARTPITNPSDNNIGILKNSMIRSFTPINIRIIAKPYLSNSNLSAISAKMKYNALRPKIAKIFDV